MLPEGSVSTLMAAIPGSDALLSAADNQAGRGGITSMLGGAGAVTQALGQLQGLGLDSDKSKSLISEVVSYAKEHTPPGVSAKLEKNLPGGLT